MSGPWRGSRRIRGPMPLKLWQDLSLWAYPAEADQVWWAMIRLGEADHDEDGGAFSLVCVFAALRAFIAEGAEVHIVEDLDEARRLQRRVARVFEKLTGRQLVLCTSDEHGPGGCVGESVYPGTLCARHALAAGGPTARGDA